ncbi:hypothetical protein GYMLUDRAFT_250865 [Collybiopsis luxurians FD-317 M1]|uniref:Uncharacterized protein n=1 Tax=Collybiopsis luxurians FD-317 M1 TaxID=944289 RepID=A0A0D0BE48_9AGAR|nr:hypothetical protein GYMLUDRAFT_250865 [Collybiopsis luxurians FD-317 M1]
MVTARWPTGAYPGKSAGSSSTRSSSKMAPCFKPTPTWNGSPAFYAGFSGVKGDQKLYSLQTANLLTSPPDPRELCLPLPNATVTPSQFATTVSP